MTARRAVHWHQVVVACCALAALSHANAQDTASSLPIDVALHQPSFLSFGFPVLSPDGDWVAYTLRYPERIRESGGKTGYTPAGLSAAVTGTRLFITAIESGRTLAVGDTAATSWGGSWSPNGAFLAYYSDVDGTAGLWVRETATGHVRRVSNAVPRAYTALQVPRWSPDSRRIIIPIVPYGSRPIDDVAINEGAPEADTSSDDTRPRVSVLRPDPGQRYGQDQPAASSGSDTRGHLEADLAVIDLATGAVTTLVRGGRPWDYAASPNGRFVAFTSLRTLGYTTTFDVGLVALEGAGSASPRYIAKAIPVSNFESARSLTWSPTSESLLFAVMDSVGRERYFVAGTDGAPPRRAGTCGPKQLEVRSRAPTGQSLWWDPGGDRFYVVAAHAVSAISVASGCVAFVAPAPAHRDLIALLGHAATGTAWTPDSQSLVAVFSNDSTRQMGFARLDTRRHRWGIIREDERSYGTRASHTSDVASDGTIIVNAEDATHPADIWRAAADLSRFTQVTHSAPAMEGRTYGSTQLVRWTTTTGARLRGTLLLPSNYRRDTRVPLVIYPYPNAMRSENLYIFGVTGTGAENMQLLATRGMAVLAPDVPIKVDDQMRELARAIVPAVDRVIEIGIADPARIGVMGHSWGGYTVLALIVQDTRFRAAVMRGGFGDQIASYGTLEPSGFAFGALRGESQLGGSLWTRRGRFIANSPIFFLDRVRTPLLIVHGDADTTVPHFLADEVYAALQSLGKKVEYARYSGENHTETGWQYPDQRDYVARMLQWFTAHLQDARDPGIARTSGSR